MRTNINIHFAYKFSRQNVTRIEYKLFLQVIKIITFFKKETNYHFFYTISRGNKMLMKQLSFFTDVKMRSCKNLMMFLLLYHNVIE